MIEYKGPTVIGDFTGLKEVIVKPAMTEFGEVNCCIDNAILLSELDTDLEVVQGWLKYKDLAIFHYWNRDKFDGTYYDCTPLDKRSQRTYMIKETK